MKLYKPSVEHALKKHLKHTAMIAIIAVVLIAMPTITFIVQADDIIVDDDGSGPYVSIQDAIDDASPDDTIIVKDGTYAEPLSITTNNLTIIANNGDLPILYLTSYSPGIDIQASNIRIEGFKIHGNANPGGGPVIRLSSSADKVVIHDNIFKVITGETGNTVMIVETGSEDGAFTDNSVENYNIGVELEPGSNHLIDSTFASGSVNHSVYHGSTFTGTNIYYGTIQDALDNAPNGSTVSVVEGVFNENVLINKSVTFQGVKTGDNPVNGRSGEETTLDGGSTSPVLIVSSTNNVTVDGFTLTMSNKDDSSNQAGVLIQPSTENITITNNIIENITDGTVADDTINDETYGIMVYGKNSGTPGQHDIIISNNVISNVEEYGIAINDNTSRVTITDNKIIELIGSDHSSDPFWVSGWLNYICSAVHLGGQVGPISEITIEGNILMTNQTGDGTILAAGAGVSFAGVAENFVGPRNWSGFQSITIEENVFSNNSKGIAVLTGFSNGSIEVHDNDFSNTSVYAVDNDEPDLHLNATDNWWGNITGPYNLTDNPDGMGGNVSGNVTFWPWYEFETGSILPFVDYDVEGPQVNFGEIIQGSTEIEINAVDNESGLLSLTYRIWNTTHRWGPWIEYTGPFTLSGQGKHRVQYNATDIAGTSTFVSSFVYEEHRVDDVPPVIEVLYPDGGENEFDDIPITWTASDRIFDQGQLQYNASIPLTEDYPGHIQSFKPTEDEIDSVQLLLHGEDANLSVKIFSSIIPIPTVIGQSSRRVNLFDPEDPTWVRFAFDSSIDLDPSQTYYLGVTTLENFGDTGFEWHYFDNGSMDRDKYPYGQAWIKETDNLNNVSTMDFAFKTLYWRSDIDITVQYSNTGMAPWSTIADGEINDGLYSWDSATYGIPDGNNYKINLLATDDIQNIGFDASDEPFLINNEGSAVLSVQITDTTIGNDQYTKNGDSVVVSAEIMGDPLLITADLSSLGKGTEVEPTSFVAGVATWNVDDIICSPPNGEVTVTVTAEDATGDVGSDSGSIMSDNQAPEIEIIKPRAGLYFLDGMRILPFSYPFIIGQITFEIDVDDNGSGIEMVEFYLENELEANVSSSPYEWTWDRSATGFFDVEIIVSDAVGHVASDEIKDLFIINFDIIGHD